LSNLFDIMKSHFRIVFKRLLIPMLPINRFVRTNRPSSVGVSFSRFSRLESSAPNPSYLSSRSSFTHLYRVILRPKTKESRCCLCGAKIDLTLPKGHARGLTREHLPPLQFFPKQLRSKLNPNLHTVPSHRECNEESRKDEEYFYHAFSIHVRESNPELGPIVFEDLKRRRHKPQTPAMFRKILAHTTRRSGILLPNGQIGIALDRYRLEQVALKLGQCIFTLETGKYLPKKHCKDIRLCRSPNELSGISYRSK
jgi:hypothetical protein